MLTHFSASPSNKDSRGLVSLRMMCIEVLKLRVKVRPMATVRRAVSFRIQHKIKHGYDVTFNISTDHTYTNVEDIPCDKFVFVQDNNKK